MINFLAEAESARKFSVLIPVYNSEKTLPTLISEIRLIFKELDYSFEIILVDDASIDGSWSVIQAEHVHGDITAVRFLRNHGHSIALKRGLEFCRGQWVITMDDDLQHPPAEIPKLINAAMTNPGTDVVMGSYDAQRDSVRKSLGAMIYQSVIRRVYPVAKKIRITSFRLIHRRVVNEIIQRELAHPNAGFIILDVTENIINVPVKYEKRQHGRSGMTLSKSIKVLVDGIAMNSTMPLLVIGIGGLALATVAFALTLYFLAQYFFGNIGISGFATIVVLITGFSGLILFSVSIVGLYVGRLIAQSVYSGKYSLRDYLPPSA